jgi:hypothetical protein
MEGLEPSIQFKQGKEGSERKAEEQCTHTRLIMTLLLCDFLVVRDGENSVSAPGVSGVRPSRIRHSVAATLNNRDNVTSSTPAQQQNPQQNKEAQ